MKIAKLMEVEWRDAASSSGPWMNKEEADSWSADDFLCHTVGYFYAEDKRYLTLAMTASPDKGRVACLWAIPKGCIVSKRVIR